ncbi:TPA: DNA-3-methyladenine glycosylase [Burkholderia territorii]|uniref:DNA-3-methyladenine glycosylase n=1 Tax=Burkholderia territorii TaxID=1503055 RepID=UPI0011CA2EA1|nr:DNA-3-methyladenine glycosylase [Burkholderia territorii]TXG15595.1 DNA-3-methyladenine glycosylase [Burkholderia territorii]HDR8859429.1 DNA-3-methyladenine glycosylase [Burkholderia territorii]HDR8865891.1 DNA-3-methyladenine glycosylase [Burkholderia territorii]HDR8871990.1 DNA-3-methyladenine glycosylase [Burkholderia territorii]HDR8880538.1 DNA-3-methyladenine glycosylase [Burkholderia territorii]
MPRNKPVPEWPGTLLPRSFFDRAAPEVAPQLLNKILAAADGRAGRIVEVEAYAGAIDPAAHTYRGKTPRNATMFGPPGHMYVYFTYGMHWCCNCVCGPQRTGTGVLIRALEPLHGLERMRAARPPLTRDRDLCRGPARLTQALGITGAQDGVDLVAGLEGFALVDDGMAPPANLAGGPRVGIRVGQDLPWRWSVPGNRHVSGPVPTI